MIIERIYVEQSRTMIAWNVTINRNIVSESNTCATINTYSMQKIYLTNIEGDEVT